MSKATEALAARGIYSPWGLCQGFGGVLFVDYRSLDSASVTYSEPGYSVFGVRGQKFSSAWYDHGARVFTLPRDGTLKDRRAVALAEALAFAAAQVSARPTRWGRDPFGAWQAMDVIERAGLKAREVRGVSPSPPGEQGAPR